MAVKLEGLEQVNRRLNQRLSEIEGPLTERFVTEVLISIASHSAPYVPVATATLINSQYRKVKQAQGAWVGEVGYGAEYAAAVNAKPGALLGTNTPRPPDENGKYRFGNVWSPNGQPRFMQKGVEEMMSEELNSIIKRAFR